MELVQWDQPARLWGNAGRIFISHATVWKLQQPALTRPPGENQWDRIKYKPCSITIYKTKKSSSSSCLCLCLRTTRHTRCRPQTSTLACHPCPASTAAVPAPHPSSLHLTPHQSTLQRELWVRCLRTPHL